MKYPVSAEYDVSGVERLARMPKHWKVVPLKRTFRVIGGSTPPPSDENWNGDIVWVTPADLSQLDKFDIVDSSRKISERGLNNCGASLVPKGSIVLSTRAPIGSLGIANLDLATNQGCKALVPIGLVCPKFHTYQLSILKNELNVRGRGSTFMELSREELGMVPLSFPPVAEQQMISAFLDRKTAEIDGLIARKRRLLALLAEKRTALITRAVTKGLDPDAPMKDSGIEWLGKIPAHWGVCQLKRSWLTSDYGLSESIRNDYGVPVLRMSCIVNGRIDFDQAGLVEDVPETLLLKKDDLLFNRTNSLDQIAKVGRVDVDLDRPVSFASYLVRIRVNELALPNYLVYLLSCSPFLGFARANAIPAIGQANLKPSRYGQIHIPLPGREEQQKIVDVIEESANATRPLEDKVRGSIELLMEQRAALITNAVTGQIKVA